MNPAVAQAEIKGKKLIATATGIGKTEFIIRGENYDDLQVPVSTLLYGFYMEEHGLEGYAPKINVNAASSETSGVISRELAGEMEEFDSACYRFNPDGSFAMGLHGAISDSDNGTFTWDGRELILNHAGKSEKYAFRQVCGALRPYTFSITLDLTDKYKAMYPDAGIENVTVERFASAVPPYANW